MLKASTTDRRVQLKESMAMREPSVSDVGSDIRDLAQNLPGLTTPVIVLTAVSIAAGPLLLLAASIRSGRLRALVAAALATLLVDEAVSFIDRHWPRPRPFVALHFHPLFPHAADASFPSGTVALAAVAATLTTLVWRRLGVGLWFGTTVVAFGCVYVGVHWISDVSAGALLGSACALTSWWVTRAPVCTDLVSVLESHFRSSRLRRLVVPDRR